MIQELLQLQAQLLHEAECLPPFNRAGAIFRPHLGPVSGCRQSENLAWFEGLIQPDVGDATLKRTSMAIEPIVKSEQIKTYTIAARWKVRFGAHFRRSGSVSHDLG